MKKLTLPWVDKMRELQNTCEDPATAWHEMYDYALKKEKEWRKSTGRNHEFKDVDEVMEDL